MWYLVLLGGEKNDFIYSRIRYLIGVKSGVRYVISHNYAKPKANSYDFLPPEKTLALHNVVILIKAVFNKNQNQYSYNIFLEQCSHQLLKIMKISFFISFRCYIMIELAFLKELILIRQGN